MNTLSESISKSKKNDAAGIARVISMFMIIGCHLFTWFGINSLAMIFNVGVYVFLIISGILYSKKKIGRASSFIKKRWGKLCIPMYILLLFLIIYNCFNSNYSAIKAIPTYLMNLQGIGFVFNKINVPQMKGLEHLWFLTAIMLCYIFLIIVKLIEERTSLKEMSITAISLASISILHIILVCTVQVRLHYFIAFLIGYAFGKKERKISTGNYLLLSIAMLCSMAIRLLIRSRFDGTIEYNNIVAPFTHIVLAAWIYVTIQYACQIAPNIMKSFSQSKLINWLDELSMYIYMTHYMFLIGPFYINLLPCPQIIQLLAFGVGTLVSAYILKIISQKVIKFIYR